MAVRMTLGVELVGSADSTDVQRLGGPVRAHHDVPVSHHMHEPVESPSTGGRRRLAQLGHARSQCRLERVARRADLSQVADLVPADPHCTIRHRVDLRAIVMDTPHGHHESSG
jgi:hypothetical protein